MQQRLHSGRLETERARTPARSAPEERRARSARTITLSLQAPRWTLAFTDCPDVVDGLETILHGWKYRRIPHPARRPDARVTKTPRGYVWHSAKLPKPAPWDRRPPTTAMSVINDVHDVFFDWFLEQRPGYLCLHGAAVRIGSGLVCFPSVHGAGKSTLCVALAALGEKVYCDDVLPIEARSNRGVAMGIAPLLRKPLPSELGARILRFVAGRAGPSDRRWQYVVLKDGEIAPFGELADIRALVLLERKARSAAKLTPLGKNEMLKEILLQNFARDRPPAAILGRLLRITERAACYRLRYGRIADAAVTVREALGRGIRP